MLYELQQAKVLIIIVRDSTMNNSHIHLLNYNHCEKNT
jgi:hypothetical protein